MTRKKTRAKARCIRATRRLWSVTTPHETDDAVLTHAVLDGVAFALKDCLEALSVAGTKVERASGPGPPEARSVPKPVRDVLSSADRSLCRAVVCP